MSVDHSPVVPPVNLSPELLLEYIRDSNLSRKKKIVVSETYGPIFGPIHGITSVLMLSPDAMRRFAEPLFKALSQHTYLYGKLLLLPPDSYHMTLRGLEECLQQLSVEALEKVDAAYTSIFGDEIIDNAAAVVLEDRGFKAGVVFLNPTESSCGLPKRLENAQAATADILGISAHSQEYHLSVGYFLTDDSEDHRAVQRIILEEAQRVLATSSLSHVALCPPRVCWYDSMKRFLPLMGGPLTL